VRETFHIPRIGAVAGCYVTEGTIGRNAECRLLRDNVVVYQGRVSSLRRFKDDVQEVSSGYECGIALERFSDLKRGDIIEPFVREQVAKKLAAQS
jgi:translation initiation factor IF-2